MADHDAVCAVSGLSIGYQPVRVLFLVEQMNKDDCGLEGLYYPLGPALKASWDRDGNEPTGWAESSIACRLVRSAFRVGLASGRTRKWKELMRYMPGGLHMREATQRARVHPDTYNLKLGKLRAAPWVPTPKRCVKALAAAGFKARAYKVTYGNVIVYTDTAYDAARNQSAAITLRDAGYSVKLQEDSTYGWSIIVRPSEQPLSLADVQAALASGGWPAADVSDPACYLEEPRFEATTVVFNDFEINTSPEEHREHWYASSKYNGFLVKETVTGFHVFHCVNGDIKPDAQAVAAYCKRLRACGIRCHATGSKVHKGNTRPSEAGVINVLHQMRSFDTLVTERRVRFADNMASRSKRYLHQRKRRHVEWAIIREDVWQRLLQTNFKARSCWNARGNNLASTRAVCEEAFSALLTAAKEEMAGVPDKDTTIEHEISWRTNNDNNVRGTTGMDPPSRVGLQWTLCHLAVLVATGKTSEALAHTALNDFSELSHVHSILSDIQHQWKPSHTGHQSVARDVIAWVHADWAELAKSDAEKRKQ